MRWLKIVGLSVALTCVGHAGVVTLSFSGTWASTAGVIHSGDAFSGTASWDPAAITNSAPFCPAPCTGGPLSSFSLNMPAADGLSIANLSDPAIVFESVFLGAGSFTNGFIEVQKRSSVDSNVYEFVFGATIPNTSAIEGASPFPSTAPSNYSVVGPTSATPEPGTSASMLSGLALVGLALRRFSHR